MQRIPVGLSYAKFDRPLLLLECELGAVDSAVGRGNACSPSSRDLEDLGPVGIRIDTLGKVNARPQIFRLIKKPGVGNKSRLAAQLGSGCLNLRRRLQLRPLVNSRRNCVAKRKRLYWWIFREAAGRDENQRSKYYSQWNDMFWILFASFACRG